MTRHCYVWHLLVNQKSALKKSNRFLVKQWEAGNLILWKVFQIRILIRMKNLVLWVKHHHRQLKGLFLFLSSYHKQIHLLKAKQNLMFSVRQKWVKIKNLAKEDLWWSSNLIRSLTFKIRSTPINLVLMKQFTIGTLTFEMIYWLSF